MVQVPGRAKLVLVMGHTACGAIKGAIASAQPATHYGWGVAQVKEVAASVADPAGPGAYPITTYSWMFLYGHYANPAVGEAVRDFAGSEEKRAGPDTLPIAVDDERDFSFEDVEGFFEWMDVEGRPVVGGDGVDHDGDGAVGVADGELGAEHVADHAHRFAGEALV